MRCLPRRGTGLEPKQAGGNGGPGKRAPVGFAVAGSERKKTLELGAPGQSIFVLTQKGKVKTSTIREGGGRNGSVCPGDSN